MSEEEVKSEETKIQTVEELHAQYKLLCQDAGNLQYKIAMDQSALFQINQKLQELNIEADKLKNGAN